MKKGPIPLETFVFPSTSPRDRGSWSPFVYFDPHPGIGIPGSVPVRGRVLRYNSVFRNRE